MNLLLVKFKSYQRLKNYSISHFESVNKGMLAPVKGASIEEVAIVEQQVSWFI